MGWGTGNIGGGASLNFKVKGYATEELLMAATGKDNEIGIITSTPITGWHFAAEQPEEMVEGEVWISTGTKSQVAFNALKKGTIMVYPLSAKQMQGGTLVDVTAKSWQDGQWVDWVTYLYNEGNECESITGGWSASPIVNNGSMWGNKSTGTITVIKNENSIYIEAKSVDKETVVSASVEIDSLVDVSGHSTLYFEIEGGTNTACFVYLYEGGVAKYLYEQYLATKDANTTGVHALDITDINKPVDILFGTIAYSPSGGITRSFTLKNVWLK